MLPVITLKPNLKTERDGKKAFQSKYVSNVCCALQLYLFPFPNCVGFKQKNKQYIRTERVLLVSIFKAVGKRSTNDRTRIVQRGFPCPQFGIHLHLHASDLPAYGLRPVMLSYRKRSHRVSPSKILIPWRGNGHGEEMPRRRAAPPRDTNQRLITRRPNLDAQLHATFTLIKAARRKSFLPWFRFCNCGDN